MACNCATDEEINKIYDAYTQKLNEKSITLKDKLKKIGVYIISFFMWIVAFPLMLIYALFMLFWEENPKINVQTINLMRISNIFKNVK